MDTLPSWGGQRGGSPEQREADELAASVTAARLALPKRLRDARAACLKIQRAWRREVWQGRHNVPKGATGDDGVDALEAPVSPWVHATSPPMLHPSMIAAGNHGFRSNSEEEDDDDTPAWLQSAAADVGVSPAGARRGSQPQSAPGSLIDSPRLAADAGEVVTPTPASPTNIASDSAIVDDSQGTDCEIFVAPGATPAALRAWARPLPASELLRRARRRLAMVAAPPASDDENSEDASASEELLSRVYFFRTRRTGQSLLRAWSAWIDGIERVQLDGTRGP